MPVEDPRFDWLCSVYKPSNKIPAFLTCVDIAGLTKGAASGAGLGNNFLSNVRAVDGIFQLVRESWERGEAKAEADGSFFGGAQARSMMPRLSTSRGMSTLFATWRLFRLS